MVPKRVTNLSPVLSTLLLLLVGLANCDLNQDKAECADKLVALATCLPYVGGQAKAPTIDCCTGLKEVIGKSRRCLCLLIKDRDDPNLGLKINLTLALNLPSACHTPTNISECVDLLHLAPNSPDAKVFEGLGNGNSSTAPVPSSGSGNGSGAAKQTGSAKNSAGWGKSWLMTEVLCGILPFVLISQFFFIIL